MTPAAALPQTGPVRYVSPERSGKPFGRVMLMGEGASLEGIDCSDCYVSIHASNVALRNCRFTATEGVAVAVDGLDGVTNVTVENCQFDGLKKNIPAQPMLRVRAGVMHVRGCVFENLPSDAITMVGGIVEKCLFRGSGYLDEAHADAIWVPRTVAPVIIRDNEVEWRKPVDARVIPNTAFQIVPTTGDIYDVLIERNRCRGGSYTIQVSEHPSRLGKFKMGRVIVRNNMLSDWLYGPLYPKYVPADLVFEENRHLERGSLLSRAPQIAR